MKRKSAIRLAIFVAVVALLGVIAVAGMPIGTSKYSIKPLYKAISQGLDLRGGVYAVYEAKDPSVEDLSAKLDNTIAALRSRLDKQGYTEATISKQGTDRIRVEIPDVADPEAMLQIIGTPGKLEFREPDGTVIFDGSGVASAQVTTGEGAQWVVALRLTGDATSKFAEATTRLRGQTIGIYMDGAQQFAPTVDDAILDGQAVIKTGSKADADSMALLISSGALPLDISQIEVRTISATLGVDALDRSVLAGIIGFGLILLFMLLIYRLSGLMADLALVVYLIIDFFLLAVVPGVQLTLPGIAGIILSIGMAVDANVIIFERMKEDMRAGKTVRSSLESGFSNAMSAIIDSNVTTIIAAFVLLFFGTGSIKGFATTLIIGVLTSMFTAVVVTRFLMRQAVALNQNRALYGGKVKGGEAA